MKPNIRATIIAKIQEIISQTIVIKPGNKLLKTSWCNQNVQDALLISLGYLTSGIHDQIAFAKLCKIPFKIVQKQPKTLPKPTKKYPYYGSKEVYDATDTIREYVRMLIPIGSDPEVWNNVSILTGPKTLDDPELGNNGEPIRQYPEDDPREIR